MKQWSDLAWFHNDLEVVPECLESICPHPTMVYRAFDLTPFDKVKCVILGQDPYHTPGVATGLAFSVQPHVTRLPPSLRNILKEYRDDLDYPQPRNGDLTQWAEEGVLLLNTCLTTEAGKPNAHRGWGWEKLTVEVICKLSHYRENVVFILWGRQAQEYEGLIDQTRHKVIKGAHPSPYSCKHFFGHRPFTRANLYLLSVLKPTIEWRLS